MSDTTHNSIYLANLDGSGTEYGSTGGSSNITNKTAQYEESPALYNHTANDIIYYNKHFYKATASISVGDTLTVGTNITLTDFPAKTAIYVKDMVPQLEEGSITLSTNTASLSNEYQTATIIATIVGDGAVSVSSSDTDVCTASISDGTITIQAEGSGSAIVTVTLADGSQYSGTTATISVTSTYVLQLTLGNTYFFGGYYWTAAENIDGGVVLQSQGMTSGTWPGYKLTTDYTGTKNYGSADTNYASNIDGDNVANYDAVTQAWYSKYSAVEKTGASYGSGLFLVSNTKCNQTTAGEQGSGNYWSALKIAGTNYSLFGASTSFAWLGTVYGNSTAWFVYAPGNVNHGLQNSSFVVAPAFNLDLTKVKLAGENNDHIILKTETYPATTAISWTNGTDAQIVEMVAAADAGLIDLYEDCGWRVGDERSVSLDAIPASGTGYTVGESQGAQTVTFVLMHRGGYNISNPTGPKKKCSFVAGLKNSLATTGYMNPTSTNSGSWEATARRAWCNIGFKGAVPSSLVAVFKQFDCITGTYNGTTTGGTNITTQDYFALAAEKEIFGSRNKSTDNEANALFQFTWYATTSNRIKTQGDGGSVNTWWERSLYYSDSLSFCLVYTDGTASGHGAANLISLAPFGCI